MKPKVIHHVMNAGDGLCSCGLRVGPNTQFTYIARDATCQTCRNETGVDRVNNRVVPLIHYSLPQMVTDTICRRRSSGMRDTLNKDEVTCARCRQLLGLPLIGLPTNKES